MAVIECHACGEEMQAAVGITSVWKCSCGREFPRSDFEDLELVGKVEELKCVICLMEYPEEDGDAIRFEDGYQRCLKDPDHQTLCSACTNEELCSDHQIEE